MESGIKRTQRDYTMAFKLSVVSQIEKGDVTYQEAQARYGIQGRSTVLVWLRKYGRQTLGLGGIIERHKLTDVLPSAQAPRRSTPVQ